MDERYSHPGDSDGSEPVPLRDHLRDVARRVELLVPESAETPSGRSLRNLTRQLSLVHDFGKLTTWFQQHIGELEGEPDGATHHARLGGLLADYVLECTGYPEEERLAGYVAVAKHHGPLPNVGDYSFKSASWPTTDRPSNEWDRKQDVLEQVENIDQHAASLADQIIREATDDVGSWEEFASGVLNRSRFESITSHVTEGPFASNPSAHPVSPSFYPSLLQIWSALIIADKTSAAGVDERYYEGTEPPTEKLRSYVDSLAESADSDVLTARERELNRNRSEALADVLESIDSFVECDTSVATLTLPTGLGKTYTGLRAALEVRDRTDSGDRTGRIVYALPFTSIIDQVAENVETVFETDGTDDLLTVHHHLSETVTRIGGNDDDEEDTDHRARLEEMVAESWRSGITVTTYVQLFESLAGPKNTQSMKLPALYGSVVVLDEPQSLPHRWWKLVRRLVDVLTTEYDATVIAMTATQPKLFDEGNVEPVELVDKPERYFGELERVKYTLDMSTDEFLGGESEPRSYEFATTRLAETSRDGESALAICNTIDSARELTSAVTDYMNVVDANRYYGQLLLKRGRATEVESDDVVRAVRDNTLSETDAVMVHLTTRIRPVDRSKLINTATTLADGEFPVIVISTQLIEAGVDVSFNRVYRDFAPMDNIVQAAGRCNRSFERDRGTVTVWWLDAPGGTETTPAQAVYNLFGDSLLQLTGVALEQVGAEGGRVLSESTVSWDAVRTYYDELDGRDIGDESLVALTDDANVAELSRQSLIDQRGTFDVVVCRTDDEYDLIEAIHDAFAERAFSRAHSLLDETKPMRVSIPIYDASSTEAEVVSRLEPLPEHEGVVVLDARPGASPHFDQTTGFAVRDTVEDRFL